MDQFLQQLVNGLILGSVFALIALGYTMVYGILGLINFAHGEIVMMGAMIGISVIQLCGGYAIPGWLSIIVGLAVAIPICGLLGFSIERIAYRPLRNAPKLAPLITAIGVSIVLQNLAMIIWGKQYLSFPSVLPETPWQFGAIAITPIQVVIVLLASFTMIFLNWLIERTKLGRAMRATAQSADIAKLMGVNINKVIAATFILGSFLAALAGLMISANYGQAHSTMGFMIGLKAFSAAVLGGIGHIKGAMLGGLLLGVIETMGAGYIGDFTGGILGSQYKDIFAFLVLIIVLVFKPSGLLGKNTTERA